MDSPLRVPPDESRGEAEKRKKRILNAPPLNKPLPKGYMLVSKISETLKSRVSASLVGLLFVSSYPTFLFVKVV